jgi:FKBP-type peptidyl-prolyl cis-trans isomerase FkpA
MKALVRLRLAVACAVLVAAVACGSSSPVAPDQSNIQYSQTDLTVGGGTSATIGKSATVTESGWLYSDSAADHKGAQFDAESFTFLLGGNQVIPGFEMGVTGMQVGGTRRIIVPPSLAYGTTGNGTIPPNAALVFDIALTNVQ